MNENARKEKSKKILESMKKILGEEETHNFLDSMLGMMAIGGFKQAQVMQISKEINELLDERIIQKHILNKELDDNENDEDLEKILT